MTPGRTITLSEYNEAVSRYEDAYASGLTTQRCSFCKEPVIEKHANWDYWPGSGTILHPHCVGHWMRGPEVAGEWWMLGFGLITSSWYVGNEDPKGYMARFMQCLGYGRWA